MENDWIEIDGVRFNHVRAFEDVEAKNSRCRLQELQKASSEGEGNLQNPFLLLTLAIYLVPILTT